MRKTQTRAWQKFTSVLASVALILGLNPSAAFATGNEDEGVNSAAVSGSELDLNGDGVVTYVSLGESMTNGYGTNGYYPGYTGTDASDNALYVTPKQLERWDRSQEGMSNTFGLGRTEVDTYPSKFADYLKSVYGDGVVWQPWAISGQRPEDFYWLMQEGWNTSLQAGADQNQVLFSEDGTYNGDMYTTEVWKNGNGNEGAVSRFLSAKYGRWYDQGDAKISELASSVRGDFIEKDEHGQKVYDNMAWTYAYEPTKFYRNYCNAASDSLAQTELAQFRSEYQEAIKGADVISVNLGTHSFSSVASSRLIGLFGGTDCFDDGRANAEALLAYYPEYQEIYEQIVALLHEQLDSSMGALGDKFDELLSVYTYAALSFLITYDESLEIIRELNPDAQIIVLGMTNFMDGLAFDLGDGVVFDMGALFGALVDFTNAYRATCVDSLDSIFVPAVEDMDLLVDEFARGEANRTFLTKIVGSLVGETVSGEVVEYLETGSLPAGKNMEDYAYEVTKTENGEVVRDEAASKTYRQITDLYQGLIDFAKGGGFDYVVPIEALAGGYSETVALEKFVSGEELSEADKFALCMYLRSSMAEGIGCHPSNLGHAQIAAQMIECWENGYTGKDYVVDEIADALNALGDLAAEYYDEAYAYAYQYAADQGYIDEALVSIDEVISSLVGIDLDSIKGTDEFKAELKGTVAESVKALEAAKELLSAADELDAESFKALMSALGEAADAAEQALVALEQAGVDVNDLVVVPALQEAYAKLTSEVIPQIEADLQAALEQAYLYVSDKTAEAIQQLAACAKDAFAEYAPEAADWIYNWLLENPEDVIAFVTEYGPDAVDFLSQYADEAVQVIGWVAANYGEAIAESLIVNHAEIIEAMVSFVDQYGEGAWNLIVAYAEALGITAQIDEQIDALQVQISELLGQLEGASDEAKALVLAKVAEIEGLIDQLEGLAAQIDGAIAEGQESLDALLAEIGAVAAELDEAVVELQAAVEGFGSDVKAAVEGVVAAVAALQAAIGDAAGMLPAEAQAAYDELIEWLGGVVAQGSAQAADWLYNWLLENPDEVIAFFEEYGSDAVEFIYDNSDAILGVVEWIFDNYGEQMLNYVVEHGDEIMETLVDLVNAYGDDAWELVKAYADALDLDSVAEGLYAQLIGYLNEAWEGILAEAEQALAEFEDVARDIIDSAFAEIGQALDELDAQIAAEAKAELAKLQAEFDRIMADIDAMIESGALAVEDIEAALAELEAVLAELNELAEQLPAQAEAAVKATLVQAQAEIDALQAMLEAELAQAVYDATHGEYTITSESKYVALGDAAIAGDSTYAEMLFDYMKGLASEAGFELSDDQFAKLVAEDMNSAEMLAALEAGEWDEDLAGADLVTVSVGSEELTSAVCGKIVSILDAYIGCAMTNTAYESTDTTDWSVFVGDEAASYLDQAIDAVRVELADELGDESAAAMVGDIVEAYVFAYCGFATSYAEVLNAVQDKAPEAEIVSVGFSNPLEDLTLTFGGYDLEVGKYAGYVADAANVQLLAYAMLDQQGNVTFVDAAAADSDIDVEVGKLVDLVAGIDFDMVAAVMSGDTSVFEGMSATDIMTLVGQISAQIDAVLEQVEVFGSAAAWMPNADGQAYIFECIKNAVAFTAEASAASETSLVRIAGEYAKDTSALISAEAFSDGGCDAVVVARDDDFRDAMSAAGLAGTLGCPILLTSRTGLSSVAADEIARLGAERAYVVGGTAALSDSVDSSLEAMGVDVERVWGEQSYDTSVACAEAMIAASGGEGLSSSAVVAYGQNFQDALSMSSFAYAHRVPILLQTFGGDSSERGLTDEAVSLVNASFPGTLYVAGGEGAVSSASLSGLSAFASGDFVRIGGYDGYETSALIAEHMVEAGLLDAGTVAVCCGAVEANGLDALSGSALAGLAGGVVLLANGQAAYGSEHLDDMLGFLSGHAGEVSSAYVLGGTYVMPSPVYDVVADVWGLPHEAA